MGMISAANQEPVGVNDYTDRVILPRISLVIPNLNSGDGFERAIQSVLGQGYPDLQIIVADGGSKDSSWESIQRHRSSIDVLINEPDDGQADGINKGFSLADGEIHCWLCSDDELLPGALLQVGKVMAENPDADVVIGDCERVFADGLRFVVEARDDTWDIIGMQNVVEQSATFWRAGLHERIGELDRSYNLAFDWDYWARMRGAGAKLLTTNQTLSRYYFSDDNKSGSMGYQFSVEAYRVIKDHGPLGGWIADIYRFLYLNFDRKGCCDKPPRASKIRMGVFCVCWGTLRVLIGRTRLRAYNWHFAVLQERGECWWR